MQWSTFKKSNMRRQPPLRGQHDDKNDFCPTKFIYLLVSLVALMDLCVLGTDEASCFVLYILQLMR